MKKILFVFLFVGLVSASQAQDRIAIGLKAGFNSTKINLSDIPSGETIKNEAKGGFLFGAYGKLKLIGGLSFQPELYYAKKQTQYSFTDNGTTTVTTSDIKSWDVPLLANLKLVDLKVAHIYGVAGPVASFISKDDLKSLKDANWTFQAGLGAQVWKLSADVRYEWGMKDISKAQFGQKTDVLTVTIGYRLFGL
ncbi:Outer membrane protein beta-barrel domain-containing protein [Saccharicrinis carchari]|uniref:Outer membrane protein beta-barrel domain-containing protein n=1 Tax=Saccharicrinis carchari TaxID=1168039 RepID=A0A521B7X3_SACCC|nr:porin family protein [Saccharicrinis carchari]SMO43197.1 Outer membrane protein beta-barrel domain-containing protein [Saccharicrinis carchari]